MVLELIRSVHAIAMKLIGMMRVAEERIAVCSEWKHRLGPQHS